MSTTPVVAPFLKRIPHGRSWYEPLRPDKNGRFILEGFHIRASLILERLPVMAPRLQKWEIDWELMQRKKFMWRLSKAPAFLKKDLDTYFNCEYFDAFYDGPTSSEDDKTNNLKSHDRRYDETLYLLVKTRPLGRKKFIWDFPAVNWKPGETLRDVRFDFYIGRFF
jgi:hypothetical protein